MATLVNNFGDLVFVQGHLLLKVKSRRIKFKAVEKDNG